MKDFTVLTCLAHNTYLLAVLAQKNMALRAKHVCGTSWAPKVISTFMAPIHFLAPHEHPTILTV